MTDKRILRIDALAIADARGFCASPASLLCQLRCAAPDHEPLPWLLCVGSPTDVDAHPAAQRAQRLSCDDTVLIPGLVNAHTHLDLTHIGPLTHDPEDGFVAWVDRVRTGRAITDDDITTSVARGIELALAGGVVAVGDIAGCPATGPTLAPWQALAASPLLGVSYLEFFAMGAGFDARIARIGSVLRTAPEEALRPGRVRLGLQPHAPNTVEPAGYRWAADQARRLNLRLATHLAETPEERRFIAAAEGPQRAFLERFQLWEPRLETVFGRGRTPAEHLEEFLGEKPLVAHVNDCPDGTLRLLAEKGASVAYCPRASSYFGAERHFGPHRYRDLLAAGVNVCIGTDSILNLPPYSVDPSRGGMSPLDEIRLLRRRDAALPVELLGMATVNGAAALNLDPAWFTFAGGEHALAGVVAVPVDPAEGRSDPIAAILESASPPRLLLHGKSYDPAETNPIWRRTIA